MSLNEFDMIRHYFLDGFSNGSVVPNILLGIGDDCALLQPSYPQTMAVSVDTMVEGVHFPRQLHPFDIGCRVLGGSASDLAAMGAKPLGFTLALTIPQSKVKPEWLKAFTDGLRSMAQRCQLVLIGGDTTKAPEGSAMTLTIQVMGEVPNHQAIRRDGAKPGDLVMVTGCLGDSAAGLSQWIESPYKTSIGDMSKKHRDYLQQRFAQPEPRLEFGQSIREFATAAIDISDGLLADLGHICDASKVGVVLQEQKIPISIALQAMDETRLDQNPLRMPELSAALFLALTGGEDYELCFTLNKSNLSDAKRISDSLSVPVQVIGEVTAQRLLKMQFKNGDTKCLEPIGYQHF